MILTLTTLLYPMLAPAQKLGHRMLDRIRDLDISNLKVCMPVAPRTVSTRLMARVLGCRPDTHQMHAATIDLDRPGRAHACKTSPGAVVHPHQKCPA
jgi:hypothetical protein